MKDVFFGPEDVKLHGVLMPSDRSGAPGIVICHPHPQYGGSMNNNVVLGVEAVMNEAGYTTLRFNFRGVGRSGGVSGDGEPERKDVERAVDFLAADASVGSIHLVGYSFGAMVGLRACIEDERVESMTGIAPPTVMDSFDFLRNNKKPLLAIAGSQDDFCNVPALEPVVQACGGKIELIPGADHFLLNEEHRAGEFAREFIASLL